MVARRSSTAFDPAGGMPAALSLGGPEDELIAAAVPAEWQEEKDAIFAGMDAYAVKALGSALLDRDRRRRRLAAQPAARHHLPDDRHRGRARPPAGRPGPDAGRRGGGRPADRRSRARTTRRSSPIPTSGGRRSRPTWPGPRARAPMTRAGSAAAGQRPHRAGRLRRRHPAARRRHVGLGRQGHLGHGRLRPVAHRVEHPRGLGGQHRGRRRPLRHGRGLRRRRERAHHRPPARGRPGRARPGRHRLEVHAEPVEAQRARAPCSRRPGTRASGSASTSIDLYQIHGPISLRSHDALAEALAAAQAEGLVKAVGVSNYSAKETRAIDAALRKRGLRLASNQIEFSLLRAMPLRVGLIDCCRELGVVPLAYSPIGQGRLTGKYSAANPPPGGRTFSAHPMAQVDAVVAELRAHRGGPRRPHAEPGGAGLAHRQGSGAHPGGQEPGPGGAERRCPGLAA